MTHAGRYIPSVCRHPEVAWIRYELGHQASCLRLSQELEAQEAKGSDSGAPLDLGAGATEALARRSYTLWRGDRDVSVELPALEVRGRPVVLLDDVASTGTTLLRAALALRAAQAHRIDVVVTHGLFVGEAVAALQAAGVDRIWSTDTIAHTTNAISVLPLLAAALAESAAR